MADTIHDIGTLVFAGSMGAMVVCAGVAALPPARNTRVFIGASVLVVAWLIVLFAIEHTGSRLVTSTLVVLDIIYAAIFYMLSRPTGGSTSREVNWASYVVALFAAIIILELGNLLYRYPGWHLYPTLAFGGILSALIAFGFWRGFGLRPALLFGAVVCALGSAAVVSYVRIVNFLTLAVILTVTVAAGKSAWRNIQAWRSKGRPPPRDKRAALSVAPKVARNRP